MENIPIHTAPKKWPALVPAVLFLFLGGFFLYYVLIGISSITFNPPTAALFILLAIVFLVGFAFLSIFVRSNRIEFYDDFLRIFQSQNDGTKFRDIKYFRIDIGDPVESMNALARGILGSHFKISDRGAPKKSSWDVRDSEIEELHTTLYFWLLYKTGIRESYEI